MKLSLFPKNEEWGTGDEALDVRLSSALRKAADHLSLESISEFYSFGMGLRARAYNPVLPVTIELTAKALLFYFAPEEHNDFLLKKLKGQYFLKERVSFDLVDAITIASELKANHKVRYENQIDFYLATQRTNERNPFVQYELRKSPHDLTAKIIFKEFKNFLNGEEGKEAYSDALFHALRLGKSVLVIEDFAEIWYDRDQLYTLSNIAF
ncbi:MAG: hypothetical protein ACXVLQ_10020 [Bacteriovorax sp.]